MTTTALVDHTATLTADPDAYLTCTHCGQVWRTFPRAIIPTAVPVEAARRPYRVSGAPVELTTTPDDGHALAVTTRWTCLCGATQLYTTPTYDTVECECGKAALRRRPPADFYINPRYGQACACCGQRGTHSVPRALVADWQCVRSW